MRTPHPGGPSSSPCFPPRATHRIAYRRVLHHIRRRGRNPFRRRPLLPRFGQSPWTGVEASCACSPGGAGLPAGRAPSCRETEPMSRRTIASLLTLAVALVAALVPWTVTSDRLAAAIARQIRTELGLTLSVRGRATVALLPVPRIKLEDVSLQDGDGSAFRAEAGQMKAELRLLPMLLARIRISELQVAGAKVRVMPHDGRERWLAAVEALRGRLATSGGWSSRIDRLVVTGAEVSLEDPARGSPTVIRKLGLLARWPESSGTLDIAGSGEWNGDAVAVKLSGLSPSLLLAGQSDAIEVAVTTRHGQIECVGHLTLGETPSFAGLVSGETPSFGALARWTGIGLDLKDSDRPVTLSGESRIDLATAEWPRALLSVGGDRLEGALALQFAGPRPQLRATLAGEELDLGWVLPMADPTRRDPPEADYDIRLSASSLRLGPLRLTDAATGILVNSERLEVSLGRASLAGGSIRGRVSTSLDGEGRDIKGQFTLDRVDLERLLAEIGPVRGLSGTAVGHATFEIAGDRLPDMARQIRGRVTLDARDGEIFGFPTTDQPARRGEVRAAAPEWRGARTRYGHAQISLDLGEGVAELREAYVDSAAGRTTLRGRISLEDGTVAVRTTTRTTATASASAPARSPLVLDVQGPLTRLRVTAGSEVDETGTAARTPR